MSVKGSFVKKLSNFLHRYCIVLTVQVRQNRL